MKLHKLLLTLGLVLSIALSACTPVVKDPVDLPDPDQSDEPIGDKEPIQDKYPVDVDPIDPSQVTIGNQAHITNPEASIEELEKLAQANNAFALALYKQLTDGQGNLIYSPFSIYQALMMTYAGAESETAQQMMAALGVKDIEDVHNVMNALSLTLQDIKALHVPGIQPWIFNIANALWMQKDFHFEQDFLDKLSANYAAGVKLVDFNYPEDVQKLINHWVALETNDKIKDIIPDGMLSEMTRLVLSNAVYFKGAWSNRFDAKDTEKALFTLMDGTTIDVDMMAASMQTAGIMNDDFSAVSLPYEGGNFAMAVVMPKDFEAYQNALNADVLSKLFADLSMSHAMVHLKMPKFKTESTFDLGKTLKGLGMGDAFDKDKADFSGMTGEKDLYISDVIHKAFIDVNEEGTEAAAATIVGMSTTSMPGEEYTITFDRPFIYMIYNTQTNAVVFMGQVVNP
jgi:serpin B